MGQASAVMRLGVWTWSTRTVMRLVGPKATSGPTKLGALRTKFCPTQLGALRTKVCDTQLGALCT